MTDSIMLPVTPVTPRSSALFLNLAVEYAADYAVLLGPLANISFESQLALRFVVGQVLVENYFLVGLEIVSLRFVVEQVMILKMRKYMQLLEHYRTHYSIKP